MLFVPLSYMSHIAGGGHNGCLPVPHVGLLLLSQTLYNKFNFVLLADIAVLK